MEDPKAVKTIKEIKDNINTFNKGKRTYINDVQKLLRTSTYWVYDTATSQFAPSKFVQCIEMNFPLYQYLTGSSDKNSKNPRHT